VLIININHKPNTFSV